MAQANLPSYDGRMPNTATLAPGNLTDHTTLADLATPCLVIDAAVVERNIARMAEHARTHGLALRPHIKTHKSKKVAGMQIAGGALGLTCAKVGEAQVMSEVTNDILLAYPAVDPPRTHGVAMLAHHCEIKVAIDSDYAADRLTEAAAKAGSHIGILVDIDVGFGRTGLQTAEQALTLARHIDGSKSLRLEGLFCYFGHITGASDRQIELLKQAAEKIATTLDLFQKGGLNTGIVSSGSTPTAQHCHHVSQLTEIRPGTYIYNDMNVVRGGYCQLEDCAAKFICTVVSNAVPDQVVIDAGGKTLTYDTYHPDPNCGHGYVVEYPNAKITQLTEEHGQVDLSRCDRRPKIGERITVIPNHICPCVNLQDGIWWFEAGQAPCRIPVDARGMRS